MTTRVINLANPKQERIYSCSPRDAVTAAYAQERHDWNTWDYTKRYGHLVTEGKYSFCCGDWAAPKTKYATED
jgi:hypothetical protein